MQRRVNLFFGREEQLNTFLVYKSEAHPPDSSLILINQNVLYLYLDRPLLGARCSDGGREIFLREFCLMKEND